MYPYMPIFLQDHINFIIAQHTYYCLLLQFSYFRRDDVFNFCRKLMSLPYLPAPHIIPAFQMLIQGVDDPVLMKLVDYVRKTWITGTVYQITSWCVFGQPIRTNNDVEVTLLPIQIKLVSEGKLPRYERQQFHTNSASIMQLWDQYSNKDVTTTQLLKRCGRINGPVLDH